MATEKSKGGCPELQSPPPRDLAQAASSGQGSGWHLLTEKMGKYCSDLSESKRGPGKLMLVKAFEKDKS